MIKPGDSKYIRDFQDLLEVVKATTPIDLHESIGDKNKRIKYLLSNYEAFCNYYYHLYCFAPFAHFHKNIQPDVYDCPNNIFLEQWSRGFAKSTHFGLFLPSFIKFNGQLNGMMVGSHNEDMAADKLADLQANFQNNQRIKNDFGEQYSYGNWEDGAFKTKDDVGFYAFGKKQNPRGTKFTWKRPNYGLVDDLNDDVQIKNRDIALADKKWVIDSFKPALWTRKWWLVVAQNKYHDNTVTAIIEEDEALKKKVHQVNILDEDGNSNWPESPDFTKELIADLEETEGAGFTRERMNTPFEEGKEFLAEWMNNWVDCSQIKYPSGVLVHYLDPSYKATDKSDFKAWVLLGKSGKYYDIIDCWIRKATSKKMWEHAFEVDEEYNSYTIKHAMEANFIQDVVHGKELERVEEDKNRSLRCLFDKRSKGDKYERMVTMQPLFERGKIRFNLNKKTSPDMKLLRAQTLSIEKGSRVNDDGPDALEGAIWMADQAEKPHQPPRSGKYKKKNQRAM
ncbi:hypothetical protein [Pinibacter soli]|uniref:Terminase n=1 Tax=Pinibacter soli TaxID=3044211 RepID=A0ABT6R9A3_9BACT|nr:hypothetical protein [Pinibacter soli]MDI3319137.1 hypothetical protein [Pinibacter soli]